MTRFQFENYHASRVAFWIEVGVEVEDTGHCG